ncbi:MAG: glutamine-hydrolyzing GMP synthase [Candidatus Micrarchaeota archaeon]|nr:glutamine-hydrolyzing GMP synthase [Candidatus Micrarchaeota archaeon]
MNVKKFYDRFVSEYSFLKDKKIIAALSGGIDSTVASILIRKVTQKHNFKCFFVDTGLMRIADLENIEYIKNRFDLEIHILNRQEEFFDALKGVTDPEKKRKIIGNLFIKILEEQAREFNSEYLLQGTIAPDWIESGVGRATIKSHHNVAGLPEKMNLKLIEPLRDLYKHEVRELAVFLGMDKRMINRQPFPGPGLAVRIIGEVTRQKADILRRATDILEKEIEKEHYSGNLEKLPWQYFCAYFPIKTVGVKGDERAYNETIVIRIVDSVDGMTANFSKINHELLERISTRITNEIPVVGRVLFDITNKPPATIEYE